MHACSATAAATIYANVGINSIVAADFNAVKAAFEGCYGAMGISCDDVGGLWNSGTSAYYAESSAAGAVQDASPCVDPPPPSSHEMPIAP